MYHEKFQNFGISFITRESIHGTANATAEYLSAQHQGQGKEGKEAEKKKVFVIGLEGFIHELEDFGLQPIPPPTSSSNLEELADAPLDPEVSAVIVGFDNEFNYSKLATASLYIRYNPGCKFVATNLDSGSIQGLKSSKFLPGTGCIVHSVQIGCGREPDVVVGKPSSWWINHIIDSHGLQRERTVMFGDRLDTDIAFAKQGGIASVLVLTGVTRGVEEIPNEIVPDFVAGGLADFVEVLQ